MVKNLFIVILVILTVAGCKRSTYPTGRINEPVDKPAYNVDPIRHPPPNS